MQPRNPASIVTAIVLFASITAATAWETTGFRTPRGKLIHTGMLQTEVVADAGQPLDRHAAVASKDSGAKTRGKHEVWTYRGSDGLYALTFQNGRLSKIEVKPARDF